MQLWTTLAVAAGGSAAVDCGGGQERRRRAAAAGGVTRGLNGGRGSACVGSLAARTVDVVVEVRVFVQLAAGWRGGSGRRGCQRAGRRRLPSRWMKLACSTVLVDARLGGPWQWESFGGQ